jgi:hypothetical protein
VALPAALMLLNLAAKLRLVVHQLPLAIWPWAWLVLPVCWEWHSSCKEDIYFRMDEWINLYAQSLHFYIHYSLILPIYSKS